MICILLGFSEVKIIDVIKSFVAQNALIPRINHCLLLDSFFQAKTGSKLFYNRLRRTLNLDLLHTAWAGHEGECDPQCAPAVLEQIDHAVGVEDVAAREF